MCPFVSEHIEGLFKFCKIEAHMLQSALFNIVLDHKKILTWPSRTLLDDICETIVKNPTSTRHRILDQQQDDCFNEVKRAQF